MTLRRSARPPAVGRLVTVIKAKTTGVWVAERVRRTTNGWTTQRFARPTFGARDTVRPCLLPRGGEHVAGNTRLGWYDSTEFAGADETERPTNGRALAWAFRRV